MVVVAVSLNLPGGGGGMQRCCCPLPLLSLQMEAVIAAPSERSADVFRVHFNFTFLTSYGVARNWKSKGDVGRGGSVPAFLSPSPSQRPTNTGIQKWLLCDCSSSAQPSALRCSPSSDSAVPGGVRGSGGNKTPSAPNLVASRTGKGCFLSFTDVLN